MDLFYRYSLYFAIYSCSGWIVETAFCSIKFRKLQNRGFLAGPLCPIYGAGAISVILVMQLMPKINLIISVFLVFFAGLFIASSVEYLTGWFLELLFKTKWWDYSEEKFNLKGRVCLENSLYFGLMCVALIFFVHPAVVILIGALPSKVLKWLSTALTVLLLTDLAVTVFSVLELNKRLKSINSAMLVIKEKLDSLQWHTSLNVRERLRRLYETSDTQSQLLKSIDPLNDHIRCIECDNKSLQKRILFAFPNLKSLRYPEHLNAIKQQLGTFIKKKS